MNAPDAAARFGSGRAVPRIEDEALLEGRGRFTDDVAVARRRRVIAFVRSPYAHARIARHRRRRPRAAMPGVLGVFTGAELAAAGVKPHARRRRTSGAPTARRAATAAAPRPGARARALRRRGGRRGGRRDARAGARRGRGDRRRLRGAADGDRRARRASAAARRCVCDEAPDNIAAEMRHGDAAATEAAFARAAHVVALDVVNQRLAPSPIEPRSVRRRASTRRAAGSTVRMSTQMPTGVRDGIAGDAARPARSSRCACWSATSAAASA